MTQTIRARHAGLCLLLACLLLGLGCVPASAEAWPLVFSYGGTGDQMVNDAVQTADGGFLLAGSDSKTPGEGKESETRGWAARLDAEGALVWELHHGYDAHKNRFTGIVPMSDGNYLLIFYYFDGENTFMEAVEVSTEGEILAVTELGHTYDIIGVLKAPDGALLIHPEGPNGATLEYVDKAGANHWTIDMPVSDWYGMVACVDGENLLLTGAVASEANPGMRALIAPMSAQGKVSWQDEIKGETDMFFAQALRLDNGDILGVGNRWQELSGATNIMHGLMARYSADGTLLWQQEYAPDAFGLSFVSAIQDGDDILALGETFYREERSIYLGRINGEGELVDEWTFTIDEAGAFSLYPCALIQNENGLYAVMSVSYDVKEGVEDAAFDVQVLKVDKPA